MSVFPESSADRRIAVRQEIAERGCRYCGRPLAYIGADQDNGPEAMRTKCWGRLVDHEGDAAAWGGYQSTLSASDSAYGCQELS